MRITHLTRTAKSAKGKLALTLFSALGVLGATGALLFGAPTPKFTVSASPSTQTVTAGQSTSFAITIARQNKFTSPVALSVSGLPAGATKSFSPSTVPGSSSSSTLTITTAAGTTPQSYPLTITGSDGSSTATRNVTLTVVAAAQPNFSLSATPGSRIISTDDSASYTVGLVRSGGFANSVALSVSGLPRDVTAQFVPPSIPSSDSSAALELTSGSNPKAGNYTLVITGTGFHNSTQITRSTSIQLSVEEKQSFGITGGPTQALLPGLDVPVDLTLTNPHNFALQITELNVSVESNTSKPGCSGADNYTVDQLDTSSPLTLPAGATETLSDLGVAQGDLPTVGMVDSATVNQDACKGATVFLNYSGAATR